MSSIQRCSECTYKGPSDTFPLKKSGKGHTKTCSHCNDRNKLKIATALQARRDHRASQSSDTPEYRGGGWSSISDQKNLSWDELTTELLHLGTSAIALDHLVNISILALARDRKERSDALQKEISMTCGWRFM
jgi:hypothetical protein